VNWELLKNFLFFDRNVLDKNTQTNIRKFIFIYLIDKNKRTNKERNGTLED